MFDFAALDVALGLVRLARQSRAGPLRRRAARESRRPSPPGRLDRPATLDCLLCEERADGRGNDRRQNGDRSLKRLQRPTDAQRRLKLLRQR